MIKALVFFLVTIPAFSQTNVIPSSTANPVYSGGTLAATITAVGSTPSTIELVSNTYTIAASLTVPANVTLLFNTGAVLSVSSGQTLTIQGPIIAPDVQIFSGAGLVKFSSNNSISTICARWWGATGDGTTDDTATLQAAFVASTTAANRPGFRIPAGVYRVCNLFMGNKAAAGCPTTAECPAPANVYSDSGDSVFGVKFKATAACGASPTTDYVASANSMSGFTLGNIYFDGGATTAGTGASCLDVSWQFSAAPAVQSYFHDLRFNNCLDSTSGFAINADNQNDSSFERIDVTGPTSSGNQIALRILAGGGQTSTIQGLRIYNGAYVQLDVQNCQISDSYLTGGLVLGVGGATGGVSRELCVLNNDQIDKNNITHLVINGIKTTGAGNSIQALAINGTTLGLAGLASGESVFGGYFLAGVTMNGGSFNLSTAGTVFGTITTGLGNPPTFVFNNVVMNGTNFPVASASYGLTMNGVYNGSNGTIVTQSSLPSRIVGPIGQQAYFASTGANDSLIVLDNQAGGHNDKIGFYDAGVEKQLLYKDASNIWHFKDSAHNWNAFDVNAAGNLALLHVSSGTTSNNDLAGILTLVGGTITYTFINTHTNAPVCTATDTTSAAAVKASATNTVLTITGTGTDLVSYLCMSRD